MISKTEKVKVIRTLEHKDAFQEVYSIVAKLNDQMLGNLGFIFVSFFSIIKTTLLCLKDSN